MKILFVYPNLTQQEYISLGIAHLSSYLKREGHKTYLTDYTFGGDISKCLNDIKRHKPDVVGFSLRSGELKFCNELSDSIKEQYPKLPIIFGGVQPTVAPEETIKIKSVDMICLGEGELALSELLRKIEQKKNYFNTKNFWFKKDGEVIKNEVRPLIENLDVLPFPDRELFDFNKYLNCRDGEIDFFVGRGCPFFCTYCINHILQNLYKGKGKYVRVRSVENVLKELSEVVKKYEVKSLIASDDVFAISPAWVKKFSQEYKKNFNLPFSCNLRPEMVSEGICNDLKSAGCTSLCIGIESGNEELRRQVLKRFNSNEMIINAFEMAKKAGLSTYSYNMVGLPFEKDKDVKKTIELNQKIKPDFLQVSIFQPYPGTQLREICEEKNWISKKDIPISHKTDCILNYPGRPAQKIKKQKQFFRFNVLKKSSLKTAFLTLAMDLNENMFISLRSKIPERVKKLLFKINNSLTNQHKDEIKNLNNIVVLMGEGIGNLIVEYPALKAIKREFPNSKVIFLMRTNYLKKFFNSFPAVDQIVELDNNFIENIRKVSNLRKKGVDLLIPTYPQTPLKNLFAFLIRPKIWIKYDSALLTSKKKVNEIELEAIERIGIKINEEDKKLKLFFKPDLSRRLGEIIDKNNLHKNIIGIHVGSRKSINTRHWPPSKWAKVIESIDKKSNKIVFIGGNGDSKETAKVLKYIKEPVVNLVDKLDISETAALINQFKLFICTNSGPMHIAAAQNIPTIAICGPSLLPWEPFNSKAVVVRKKIKRESCYPPCDKQKCKYGDYLCIRSIKAQDVIKEVNKMI